MDLLSFKWKIGYEFYFHIRKSVSESYSSDIYNARNIMQGQATDIKRKNSKKKNKENTDNNNV